MHRAKHLSTKDAVFVTYQDGLAKTGKEHAGGDVSQTCVGANVRKSQMWLQQQQQEDGQMYETQAGDQSKQQEEEEEVEEGCCLIFIRTTCSKPAFTYVMLSAVVAARSHASHVSISAHV